MDVSTIIMGIVLLFLVALLGYGWFKRKKYNEKLMQMREELKVGDRIMTDTGVVGEIIEKRTENEYNFVLIKTGIGKNVGYLEIHENAVYYVFNKEGEASFATNEKIEAGIEQPKEDKETKPTENK